MYFTPPYNNKLQRLNTYIQWDDAKNDPLSLEQGVGTTIFLIME